ncbi:MAG: WG repeat-containing protein [Cyclobacteriaceae bacterium]|nr:WG repeat-containing protein [Cyclobacteriaceae bacterium]
MSLPSLRILILAIIATMFFILISSYSRADGPKALRLLEKQKYVKLEDHLRKSIRKQPKNAGAWYVYARMHFDDDYFFKNIDTAYHFVNLSIRQFPNTEAKELKKLDKVNINPAVADMLKRQIENEAFQRAKKHHNIEAYTYFMDFYNSALQVDSARDYRYALAYQQAVDEDTYESFSYFISTYPDAPQIPMAKQRYDVLLYRLNTRAGTIASFEHFLRNNPGSPYTAEAERQILEIYAADNSMNAYMQFIEKYPRSPARKVATDMLYHRFKVNRVPQDFSARFNILTPGDSLSLIIAADTALLVPVYDLEKYGFMSSDGKMFIQPAFEDIPVKYFCGNIEDDVLEVEENGERKIISRLGHVIYSGEFETWEDIGSGLIRLQRNRVFALVHKSGRRILDFNYEKIENLENAFISYQYDGKWGLMSFTGKELLPADFEDAEVSFPFVILKKEGKYAISNVQRIKRAADLDPPDLHFIYDDFLLMDNDHLLVFSGKMESLIAPDLKIVIPLDTHKILNLFDGWMTQKNGLFRLYDARFNARSDILFESVLAGRKRASIRRNTRWAVLYPDKPVPQQYEYDSIRFISDQIGILFKGNQTLALFENDSLQDISGSSVIRTLQSQIFSEDGSPRVQFLYTRSARGQVKVYNVKGQLVLDDRITDVQIMGDAYLLVEKSGKKGLYSLDGNVLLRERYDGIGNFDRGYVSLLLNRRFGMYNAALDVSITPAFDKMIVPFSNDLLIASKNNKLGLIDNKSNLILNHAFEDIRDWNDSVALVRRGEFWELYDIKNKKTVFDGIESFEYLKRELNEKIIIIQRKSQVGVLHSQYGNIVSATFNDIVNVGSVQKPVYFAEKYVQEAEFYIVIYYDYKGKVIKKQVFTTEEYDKIYCG